MAEKAPEPFYCCEICGEEGMKDSEIRSHMLVAHIEGAISCPFCDLSEITADEMIIHVNSAHFDFLSPEEDRKPSNVSNGHATPSIVVDGACAKGSNMNHNANLGSPLRSNLRLNLGKKKSMSGGGTSTDRGSEQVTNCPLCGHQELSTSKLQEHINRQHFDLTSPSFPTDLGQSEREHLAFTCPLCVRCFASSADVELHVNMEHRDILSPARSATVTPGDENSNENCPVCGMSGFSSGLKMAMHIEEHFERKASVVSPKSNDLCADRLLAQELERQEREARKLQEQREFQMLQAQYGMDNQGNFREQSLVNM